MEGSDFLLAGVLFLFAAVAAVPLASRLGIGAVLGYLLAGIAIGPWGLGFISDVDEILHFSELGVVFLMFIIGLELNPSKLWQLRRSIFGVGAAQVLLSAALLAGLLMLTDFAWQAAVVGGIGLAMSSTAMALQLMREKGMNRSESGQLGFCWGCRWRSVRLLRACCWQKANIATNWKQLSTRLRGCCSGYFLSRSECRSTSVCFIPICCGWC